MQKISNRNEVRLSLDIIMRFEQINKTLPDIIKDFNRNYISLH